MAAHESDARALTAAVGLHDERRVGRALALAEGAVPFQLRRPALADPPGVWREGAKVLGVEPRADVEQLREADLAAHAHHRVEAVDPRRDRKRQEVGPPHWLVAPHDAAHRRAAGRHVSPAEPLERERERLLVVGRRCARAVDLRRGVSGGGSRPLHP